MATLKELLSKKLTKKELALVPSAYDVVGHILIFAEFPQELNRKQGIIGNTIIENNKHIHSVYKKSKKYSGKYRTPTLTWVAGKRSKETEHKENGVRIQLDVGKVYFSPRTATERARVATLVKKNEDILVMFSGSGVLPMVLGKNTKAKHITGIEANPTGHKYTEKNAVLNKLQDKVASIKGDIRTVLPKKKYDRVFMPLPKGAEAFLDITLPRVRKGGTVHLYTFGSEEEFSKIKKHIVQSCKGLKRNCSVKRIVKCGQYSPRVYRLCVDFVVN